MDACVSSQSSSNFSGESSPSPRRHVHGVLEAVHRDLAIDRRDRVLDPSGQEVEAALGLLGREQPLEGERLAEDGCGLGRRQRRGRVEEAERGGEVSVEAVPELVRGVSTERRSGV